MNKIGVRLSAIALLLFLPVIAQTIDDNAGVKVTPLLKTTDSWDGQQIVYPQGQAELTALLVEIAPGGSTGWHHHPVPSFGFLLEGTLEITLKDGRVKLMQTGEALSEVSHTVHIGRALGDSPVKIVVFYAGAVGNALTVNLPKGANLSR